MNPLIVLDLVVTFVFIIVLIAALLVYGAVFWSIFRDAPFVPSPRSVAEAMMDLAEVKKGEEVVDLGSGHGEIMFAAARREARAIGYELSLFLCWVTILWKVIWYRRANVKVIRHDFFGANLTKTQVVTCYLFSRSMELLRHKFEVELAPGTRVVTAQFPIRGWTPEKTIKVANRPIYLYRI